MPTCPNGHQSAADDWCEVCGHRMPPAPGAPAGAVPPPPPAMPGQGGYGYPGPGGDSTMQAESCPQCRTPREGQAPLCGECRYNFLAHSPAGYAPPPPPPPPSQAPGGSMGSLNLPPGFQAQGPPSPPPPPGASGHFGPGPHAHGQPGRPDFGPPPQQPQHHQPQQSQGYGYPQPPQPPAPPQQGGDDWTLPPPGPARPQHHPHEQPGRPDFGPPPQQPQHHQPQQSQGYGYPQPPQPQPPQPPAPPQQGGPQGYGRPEYGQPEYGQPEYGQQGPPQQHQQPQQQQPATWMASIGPDHEYFTAMMRRSGPEAAGLNIPAYASEQRIQLNGPQVTIGRRRHSTGESPDIDLGRQPEDPGVSHQHAVLVQQPDGSWSVVDQDSTNGTTINGAEEPIQPFVPVPLREGDRVHVGAWTTITVYRG
ncbi:FHA domain-containing protein [Streptomyces desertarenae]|uniref:FHA domain-containing protein n=1 Tax=Streptomyces desertarenae TaxID=2666184 RepID=A0ABW4PE77_9ACTN